MGFFETLGEAAKTVGDAAKKAVDGYNGKIEDEKKRMARFSDSQLARIARSNSFLPSGMAAMAILKERGYTGRDVATL
jgi:hypothetical protein